jgi:AcrR family transcriptional regulator
MTTQEAEPSGGVPGRRAQLLAAAREVLAEHGYERTTVSSIATKASVAQGTFYLYFPSKEALPGALSEQMAAEMGIAADRASDGPDLTNGLERLAQESFAVGEAFRDILLVANRGIELCPDYEQWAQLTAPWREGIERFLRHFQQTGEVSQEIDVTRTAMVIRDVVDRAVKAKILFDQQEYADAMVTVLRRALAV